MHHRRAGASAGRTQVWETSVAVVHAGGFCGLQRHPSVQEPVAVREGKDSIFLQLWWTRGRGEAKRWKVDRKRQWKKSVGKLFSWGAPSPTQIEMCIR